MNRRDFFKAVAALSAAAAVPLPVLASASEAAAAAAPDLAHGPFAGAIRSMYLSMVRPAIAVQCMSQTFQEFAPTDPHFEISVDIFFVDQRTLPEPGSIVDKNWFLKQGVTSRQNLPALFRAMPEDLRFWIKEVYLQSSDPHLPMRIARLEMAEVPV